MYIDESGNTGTNYKDKQQPYFTMSGVIIKDGDWIKVDEELSELKKNLFGKKDIEIHSALMYNPRRNTPFWGQRTLQQNLNALEAAVDFMADSGLGIITVSIHKPSIKDIIGQDIKIDPYYFALVCLSYWFDLFLTDKKSKGSIITDRIDSIDEKITYSILNILRLEEEYKINNIIERPLKTDSKMSNMVQLADVSAFFENKYFLLTDMGINDISDSSKFKREYILKNFKKINSIENPNRNLIDYKMSKIIVSKFKELIKTNAIKMGE
ncbi:MAG: DUF3800 domain-containing protein [Oscillospiraceae bacterium]|nr:DUF3800 domain-containing protein [Oscillospiraceae bacterium]